jgi:hypothetical protein
VQVNTKVRAKVNTAHIKKRYQAGRDKSLDRIGSFTMQAAKKQFLNKTPKKKPQWRKIGEREGTPVLEVTFRPPTPGRVTSWKTGRGRGARGFLRSSIRYDRDNRRGSVLIGPAERSVWLNKIQEFGGRRPVAYRYLTKRPVDRLKNGAMVPQGMGRGGSSGGRDSQGRFLRGSGGVAYVVVKRDAATGKKNRAGAFKVEPGKVKSGQYMAKGLDKVRAKIPKAFANSVQGP